MLSKIPAHSNICRISLDFDGMLIPSTVGSDSSFFNTADIGANWIATHFGKGSVSFKEESFSNSAGTAYKQSLTLRLPYNDQKRAIRTSIFQFVKNIKLDFTNGISIAIGRNDIRQNRNPKVATKGDEKFLVVEFYTESITPVGQVITNQEYFGFPEILPVNFDI